MTLYLYDVVALAAAEISAHSTHRLLGEHTHEREWPWMREDKRVPYAVTTFCGIEGGYGCRAGSSPQFFRFAS